MHRFSWGYASGCEKSRRTGSIDYSEAIFFKKDRFELIKRDHAFLDDLIAAVNSRTVC